MPYSADISRNNPGCFLFLIDQSGSMMQALGGQPGLLKMDMAADTLNRTLQAICQRCSQGEDIRDYFDIGLVGYNTDVAGNPQITPVFPGTSPDQPFLPISEVVNLPQMEERQVRESDGAGGTIEVTRRFPIWLSPEAFYGTPMCGALRSAVKATTDWTSNHRTSYPPIVINVTDGMASDGDPRDLAQELMGIATEDGNVLLFNVHLSEMSFPPVQFPDSSGGLRDEFADHLFNMSSVLPESSRSLAETLGIEVSENSRGFVFNANLEALVQFLDIGTRGATGTIGTSADAESGLH